MSCLDDPKMPDDPNQEWDIVTYDIDGYTVRLSWLGLTPRFQILGTGLPIFRNTVEVRHAIDQLIGVHA
jgi:hypothetical protein